MIIKDKQYNNFLVNVNDYSGFLIYGPDNGLVKERSTDIRNKLTNIYKKLDYIKLSEEDISDDTSRLVDLIYQTSIFSSKSLINIDLVLSSNLKFDENIFSDITPGSSNFFLLEAGNLKKTSILIKSFSNAKNLACIPCYQDTNISIKKTIIDYSKKFNLSLEESSIDYLSNRLGSDRLVTLQEIKKLAIYGAGKTVSFNDVLRSTGDSSLITINKICDNLFINTKAIYYYEKIIESGYSNIIVIRSLLSHFYLLLKFKDTKSSNTNNFFSYLHFSRHSQIQKQLNTLGKDKIDNTIFKIFVLEKNCKQNYNISDLLIKKFLLNCSQGS